MTSFPGATYRLQLNPKFGFRKASQILEYLELLGVSDIYASPVFRARSGSSHGYDVVDPLQINPELGGKEEFLKLVPRLKQHHLGWIQDIVPNHMAFHSENSWLMDVFEKGSYSPYYFFFDIDWDHPYSGLKGRVLAPFLGKFYGEVLKEGELELSYDSGRLTVHYYSLNFPLRIESLSAVFKRNIKELKNRIGENHPDYIKFSGVLYVLDSLRGESGIKGRDKQLNMIKEMIRELYEKNALIREHMNRNLKVFRKDSGVSGRIESFNSLLNSQFFRLSFWKVAMEEINYRRFFNINDLISLRMEKEEVFNHFHGLVFDYIRKGIFTGLRVDHLDGLYDPEEYLKRVRRSIGNRYLIVEKILESGESLPESFPVEGTTGYDWMNRVNQVFCRPDQKQQWSRIYSRFAGINKTYPELTADKKRLIIGNNMAGDIDNLARRLKEVSEQLPGGQDFTLYGLKRAAVEILVRFPIYRTYNKPGSIREYERKIIHTAVEKARLYVPAMARECAFIGRCLLMEWGKEWNADMKRSGERFARMFQQYSGPVMAKGFEDTLLYVYNRLLSLNEVGGNPDRFGGTLSSFHEWNRERQRKTPFSLNASATHDNKRGEDVRARINVLSEIPEEWDQKIRRWNKMNFTHKTVVEGEPYPDANDEYFLYQTLIGSFPFGGDDLSPYRKRIRETLIKTVREAKVHTAWLNPDRSYEEAYVNFFEKILRPETEFYRDFVPFQRRVSGYGIYNSLSQVLLKITLPGIPDFYQGCEFWDLNLVDPDNRRPVDFKRRLNSLRDIIEHKDTKDFPKKLWKKRADGRIKQYIIWKSLGVRRRYKRVFDEGGYIPLQTEGLHKNRLIAFVRRHPSCWILSAVPRWIAGLMEHDEDLSQAGWGDTFVRIPEEAPCLWKNAFSGREERWTGRVPAARFFEFLPVALYTGQSNEQSFTL